MIGVGVWQLPTPDRTLVLVSLFFSVYYTALSVMASHSRRTTPVRLRPDAT